MIKPGGLGIAHHAAAHQAAAAAAAAAHQHQAAAAAAAAQHPLNQAAAAAAAMQALHASIAPPHLSQHGCPSLSAAAAAAAAVGSVGPPPGSGPTNGANHASAANMALSASLGCSMVTNGQPPNGNAGQISSAKMANTNAVSLVNTMMMPGGCSSPCSTLFIANLGQFVVEQELKDLFSSFPGFCRLKMHSRGGAPVAFIEYTVSILITVAGFVSKFRQLIYYYYCCIFVSQDVRLATHAMNSLQNYMLFSSDRGGMRIEYAKHKMGEMPQSHVTNSGSSGTLTNGHNSTSQTVLVTGSTISNNPNTASSVTSLNGSEPMELIAPIEQC